MNRNKTISQPPTINRPNISQIASGVNVNQNTQTTLEKLKIMQESRNQRAELLTENRGLKVENLVKGAKKIRKALKEKKLFKEYKNSRENNKTNREVDKIYTKIMKNPENFLVFFDTDGAGKRLEFIKLYESLKSIKQSLNGKIARLKTLNNKFLTDNDRRLLQRKNNIKLTSLNITSYNQDNIKSIISEYIRSNDNKRRSLEEIITKVAGRNFFII